MDEAYRMAGGQLGQGRARHAAAGACTRGGGGGAAHSQSRANRAMLAKDQDDFFERKRGRSKQCSTWPSPET
eukprot:347842-Chlamydomonas_euryale.AAC.5